MSGACRCCRPPSSLVSGHESTIFDIVWMSPQTHISLSVRPYFSWHVQQWLCPVQKRFIDDHWRRGRWKPGGRTVGSSTSEELITVADCQSSRHRLDAEAVVSAAGFTLQTGCLDGSRNVGWSVTSLKSGRWSLNSTLLSNLDISSSRRTCGGGIWQAKELELTATYQRLCA